MSEDPILAGPSADCCLDCFPHDGTPRGKWEAISGIETYVATPLSGPNSSIIMYFPDVWGIDTFVNGQLLVDYFAQNGAMKLRDSMFKSIAIGFTVLALDYFRGDSVQRHRKNRHDRTTDPNFDYDAWKRKHSAFADEHVPHWIDEVVKQYGTADTKYATVGYCFGAPYVMNSLRKGSIFSAGAFGHPAFLSESHFYNCAKPLLLSCAETDHTFPSASRHRAEEILSEVKATYQVQLFSGTEHGFALRGDMSDPYQRWVKEQSADAIIRWFKLHMGSK